MNEPNQLLGVSEQYLAQCQASQIAQLQIRQDMQARQQGADFGSPGLRGCSFGGGLQGFGLMENPTWPPKIVYLEPDWISERTLECAWKILGFVACSVLWWVYASLV